MKVNHTTFFMGEDTCYIYRNGEQSKNPKSAKVINGSAIRSMVDPVMAKKEEAKKKGLKLIGDAFYSDKKIDEDLETRRGRVASLQEELGTANKTVRELEESRAALREEYNVDPDSREESDLKLLEKEVRSHMVGSGVSLSKEEIDEISAIRKKGLTEYQQRSLEMFEAESPHVETAYKAKQEIQIENQIISATELERLKSHTMLDAKKQADAIMEEASKEVVGMLVEEATDHMDEESEEVKEKAQAEKEKQEELEAKLESAKEKKKENEELTETILEGAELVTVVEKDMEAAQEEIKDMLSKMNLIEADIKGAAVDKSL